MISVSVNELIKDTINNQVFRVLWIDEGRLISYVIDIEDSNALPFIMTIKDISTGFIDETYIKIETLKFSRVIRDEDLSPSIITRREKAWKIIKPLVEKEPAIYIKEERSRLINELVDNEICTKKTAYKYLRKYWQNGKTVNSLCPDYRNSGSKGKCRKSGEKKRGRPRRSNSKGINITEEIKEIFRKAIKKYYFTSRKNPLTFAYDMMLKEFFINDVRFENGIRYIVIKDEDSIPSMDQFRYWFKKEFNLKESIILRDGEKKFERNFREVLGSSTYEAIGPGTRYQVDATPGNIYLISSYNSDWIIGRPIIYFVIDVFSHMITGVYIGLEGPSWTGMMMAIANAASNKREFCRKYRIEITDELWPASHIPEIILGDRGELESYNANSLVNGLGISIENNPAFRPDWKGIVEQLFKSSQDTIKPFLPGYIQPDFQERGSKDYRLEAKLTLEQYTKIIINFILHYNKNFYMKDYPLSTDMIEDNLKPTPIELWKWGIKNRAGILRKVDEDTIKFYLMPRGQASVTSKGIKFKGMLYSCETAIRESWFIKARKEKRWKVDVSYDPRNMNSIYLHTGDMELFETCTLLEHQERYQDKMIEEIEQLSLKQVENYKNNEHEIRQAKLDFYSEMENIVDKAVKSANETQAKDLTKKEKISDIQSNRAIEKERKREDEAFQIGRNQNFRKEEIKNPDEDESLNQQTTSIKDLFNRRRELRGK